MSGQAPATRVPRRAWLVAAVVVAAVAIALSITLFARGEPTAGPSSPASTLGTGTAPTSSPSAPAPEPTAAPTGPPATPPAESEDPVPVVTVPIDGEAEVTEQVTARVSAIEAVDGVAKAPGEVGGPSLRVTIEIDNGTATSVDLRTAVVNLYHGPDATPAAALGQPGASAFPTSVSAGETASGVFVFSVPVEARSQVRVELDLRIGGVILAFEGPAPS